MKHNDSKRTKRSKREAIALRQARRSKRAGLPTGPIPVIR